MKKVLLLWYTINSNFGDVLIYETVKEALETSGMEVSYIDVGKPCREIFCEANKHDFLLFAGGGIIERYVPNVIRYFKEDYEDLTVPYGIIGLSIGGFDYIKYKEQIGFWVQNAEFFYTRDEYSAEYLNRLSSTNKVVEGVDIVWANNQIINNVGRMFKGSNVRDVP
jgi:polysaccharide pyruvyl transferase WcaK-like protein